MTGGRQGSSVVVREVLEGPRWSRALDMAVLSVPVLGAWVGVVAYQAIYGGSSVVPIWSLARDCAILFCVLLIPSWVSWRLWRRRRVVLTDSELVLLVGLRDKLHVDRADVTGFHLERPGPLGRLVVRYNDGGSSGEALLLFIPRRGRARQPEVERALLWKG